MKKLLAATALCGLLASTGSAGAANMMMEKMQCSAACNTQYMQCVMGANQMTSVPAEALNQIMANFQGSTACGQEAIACQQSCS
ncbi:hypothetical protein [Salaquimonas pukyongi]|uniref:hypothetical protein n=1 Tax=Salaquimonas pukyongi TaxID=2712698 RepID=UPI00096B9BB1|nr:hypothetical protein [Salaquimonas pukyongi]